MQLASTRLPEIQVVLTPADCGMLMEAARALVKLRSEDVATFTWPSGMAGNNANRHALQLAINFELQVVRTLGIFAAPGEGEASDDHRL